MSDQLPVYWPVNDSFVEHHSSTGAAMYERTKQYGYYTQDDIRNGMRYNLASYQHIFEDKATPPPNTAPDTSAQK